MSTVSPAERIRHNLQIRHLSVRSVQDITSRLRRITFAGELEGFAAPGPADHVKVFFPDPSGRLALPQFSPDGTKPPTEGTVIARDYTPAQYRTTTSELDLDFVLHGDDGPASAWAARAQVGDQIAIGGPRGSALPPTGVQDVTLIADETALPAAKRWALAYPDLPVTGIFVVTDSSASRYLDGIEDRFTNLVWFAGPDGYQQAEARLRELTFGPSSFIFLAGEAGGIVALRRYLRRELGLEKQQVDAHGYWKQGVENLDHHAPLDPGAPEEER